MALIKCSECGQMVSDRAECCPNCGLPQVDMQKSKANIKCLIVGATLLVVGLILLWLTTDVKVFGRHFSLGVVLDCVVLCGALIAFAMAFKPKRTLTISIGWMVVGIMFLALMLFLIYDYYDLKLLNVRADDMVSTTASVVVGITALLAFANGIFRQKKLGLFVVGCALVSTCAIGYWYYDKYKQKKVEDILKYEYGLAEGQYKYRDAGWQYILKHTENNSKMKLESYQELDEKTCSEEKSPLKNLKGASWGFYKISDPSIGDAMFWVFFKYGEPRFFCFQDDYSDRDLLLHLIAAWDDSSYEEKVMRQAGRDLLRQMEANPSYQQMMRNARGY